MRHLGIGLTALVLVPLLAGSGPCGSDPKPRQPLGGFVDLHTHPVSNVGFGGKLIYGGASVGALLPSDPDCKPRVRATSEGQALGHDRAVHGGFDLFNNRCGNSIREILIHMLQGELHASNPPSDAYGFPTFRDWPVWNDMTHQKMWTEWIRRSFAGGLRVMVALAVNNKTLGDLVTVANLSGTPDLPTDDKASADLQIDEIERFVAANSDFMEIALTAEDIARITSVPKLAVVIGVEIDHIGNLQTATWSGPVPTTVVPSASELKAEIHRLYNAHVRYIFPIHLLDNAFGGTATYEDLFNVSNVRESGAPWRLKCACAVDGIGYVYKSALSGLAAEIIGRGVPFLPGPGPTCSSGQRNALALTANGIEGIREMMRLGMLIDIDHMSQDAVDQTLSLAEAVTPGGYPLNSGHNNVRGAGLPASERALTVTQYRRIAALHGMAGVGSSGQDAASWLTLYNQVLTAMGPGAVAGFGTDTNGFGLGMPPRPGPQMRVVANPANAPCQDECPCGDLVTLQCTGCKAQCNRKYPPSTVCVARCDQPAPAVQYTDAFPASMDGPKTWNYNTDGVAHYGMLPDFLKDVGSLPGGAVVVTNVMSGAEYFYQTWRKAEAQRDRVDSLTNVVADVGTCAPSN